MYLPPSLPSVHTHVLLTWWAATEDTELFDFVRINVVTGWFFCRRASTSWSQRVFFPLPNCAFVRTLLVCSHFGWNQEAESLRDRKCLENANSFIWSEFEDARLCIIDVISLHILTARSSRMDDVIRGRSMCDESCGSSWSSGVTL